MSETHQETIAALRLPGPASDSFQEFVADALDSLLADRARMEKETADKVANAYYEGAMAALGCDWWEDGPDFFALVGQDYAAGKALPSTMPQRRAEGVAALQQAGEPVAWGPIETAPRDGTAILLGGLSAGPRVDIGRWGNGRYLSRKAGYHQAWVTNPGHEVTPTHWIPLPPPPLPQQTALVEGGAE